MAQKMQNRMLNLWDTLRHSIRLIKRDRRAVTAPVVAILIPLFVALIGGAVDVSRLFWVKNRLQGACDAAVLAGRQSIKTNGYDSTAKAVATTYFGTNFDQNRQGATETVFTSNSDSSGNAVKGTATAKLPMIFMRVFGWSQANLSVKCTSTMGVGNSDITLVLDVTGSMDSSLGSTTRIAALRTAVKNFYTTVATAVSGSNARIRYSFVPYSQSVNVGHLLYDKNPDYLVDTWSIQSRVPIFDVTTNIKYSGWSSTVPSIFIDYSSSGYSASTQHSTAAYDTQWACTAALPATGAWTNSGSPTISTSTVSNGSGTNFTKTASAQSQTQRNYACYASGGYYYIYRYDVTRSYVTYSYNTSASITDTTVTKAFNNWEYRRVSYDVSSLKAFNSVSLNNGSSGAAANYTWDGCIEERETVPNSTFTYSSITGMSPAAATDLDIDTAPTSDDATKWAPMLSPLAYYRTNSSGSLVTSLVTTTGGSTGTYCATASSLLAAMNQTQFNAVADSLSAAGNTYLDIGLIWGARLSSPDGMFADIVNATPTNGGQIGRHLIFMTDGQMQTSNDSMQSYGVEFLDRRTTSDGTDSQSDTRHTKRFRAICDAIKAKGIRIWVIAFTSSLSSDLTYCASSSSSYTASTSAGLDTAFQSIAKQVGELRLSE